MGRIGALAALMVMLAGCGGKERAPIADSTMVDLLLEFHLANARSEIIGSYPAHLRDSIFARYGVDSTSYREASKYYAEHPEEYGQVYSRVLDRLNLERLSLPADTGARAVGPFQTPLPDTFPGGARP